MGPREPGKYPFLPLRDRGQVEVYDEDSTNIVLTPNTKAEAIGGKLVTSEFSDYDPFLWREGIISFENVSWTCF